MASGFRVIERVDEYMYCQVRGSSVAQCEEITDGTPLLIMFAASVAVLVAALSLLLIVVPAECHAV